MSALPILTPATNLYASPNFGKKGGNANRRQIYKYIQLTNLYNLRISMHHNLPDQIVRNSINATFYREKLQINDDFWCTKIIKKNNGKTIYNIK